MADDHDIDAIALPMANNAQKYNFCVLPPASLTGRVRSIDRAATT